MRALLVTDSSADNSTVRVTNTARGVASAAAVPSAVVRSAPTAVDDVDAAAHGDRLAFERLYRTHVDRVYTLCVRMLGERGVAEDVTQDVFVRVWQKLPGFRGESAFTTWLHRVAVNVILTRRKSISVARARTVDDADVVDTVATRPQHVGDAIDLEGAIQQLPNGARRVFVLHDVEGYTHEEIGDLMGITPGGSKAQLHRARMLLRAALTR